MKQITKIRINADGDITDVMFNDGEVADIKSAISMAKNNEIRDVSVGKSRSGSEFIRSNPNNTTDDNLKSLPRF